jgi:hypothetical protein
VGFGGYRVYENQNKGSQLDPDPDPDPDLYLDRHEIPITFYTSEKKPSLGTSLLLEMRISEFFQSRTDFWSIRFSFLWLKKREYTNKGISARVLRRWWCTVRRYHTIGCYTYISTRVCALLISLPRTQCGPQIVSISSAVIYLS